MQSKGVLKLNRISKQQNSTPPSQGKQYMVILNGRFHFLINKQKIGESHLLAKQFLENGLKICFINEKFEVSIFQWQKAQFNKVVKCLMGTEVKFDRNEEIINLMEIVRFLQIKKLQEELKNDINDNFDDYGFFTVFEFAQKFDYCQLKLKCLEQLLSMEFEQINFNRFELLQKPKTIFEYLIKVHNYFQEKDTIAGLDRKEIQKLIQEYCSFNNTAIDVESLFKFDDEFIDKIIEVEILYEQQFKQGWVRFRTPSFNMTFLSESISFGGGASPLPAVKNSAQLMREETGDSHHGRNNFFSQFHQFMADVAEVESSIVEKSEEYNERIKENFSMMCQTEQNKFILEEGEIGNRNKNIASTHEYFYSHKSPKTPETPESPSTPHLCNSYPFNITGIVIPREIKIGAGDLSDI